MNQPLRTLLLAVPFLLPLAPAKAQDGEGPAFKSPVPYAGIARMHTLKLKDKRFMAEATYPTFRSRTPLARFANAQIRSQISGSYNAWLKESKKSLRESSTSSVPLEFQLQTVLMRYRPRRIISMRFDEYQFNGGTHGMGALLAHNFGMVGGKPKELVLGDLFRPGTPYRAEVEKKIFAKLKKDEGATWVQDRSVKTLTTSQFNNFTISPSGLTWVFNQYEMGPYSNGIFEIKLTPAELGPNFKREFLG